MIKRTTAFECDLIDIWCYIAEDSPDAASRVIQQIEARVDSLGKFPNMGERQPMFGKDVRRLLVGNYAIYYIRRTQDLLALRVIHTAREIDRL